jgi:hypothetical protein
VLLASLLLGLVAACRNPPRDESSLGRVWESEHFVYHSRHGDDSVCEGVLGTLEGHFAAVRAAVGFPWTPGKRVVYKKFLDHLDLRRANACTLFNEACFVAEDGLSSSDAFDLHELAHAYLVELGNSHPALEEGIAEALSCGRASGPTSTELTLSELFDNARWDASARGRRQQLYRAAARLVAEIVRAHGSERFLALYAAARRGQTLTAVDAVSRELLGETLEAVWQRAVKNRELDAACLISWECAAKPFPTGADATWFSRCEQDDRVFTLQSSEPMWMGEESVGPSVRFGTCPSRTSVATIADFAPVAVPESEMAWKMLRSGRYFVAGRDSRVPPGITLRGGAGESSTPAQCDVDEPLEARFARALVVELDGAVVFDGRSPPFWVRIRDIERQRSSDYTLRCSSGVQASWCPSCDAQSCEPVCEPRNELPLRRFSEDDIVLRVDSLAPGPHWIELVRRDH